MPRILILVLCLLPLGAFAQVDEHQWGGWYVFNGSYTRPGQAFGVQGDVQHRNWDIYGDLEQLLVRGAVSWAPAGSRVRFAFGLAHITSGTFGPSADKSRERRVYQEATLPQTWGERGFVTHRLRFEQREVDGQDLRTRLRYFLGLNYPLNQATLGRGALFVAASDEVFFNLENGIGRGRRVDYFDRNRFSLGLGYSLSDTSRIQFALMHQRLDDYGKNQIQLSWTQNF